MRGLCSPPITTSWLPIKSQLWPARGPGPLAAEATVHVKLGKERMKRSSNCVVPPRGWPPKTSAMSTRSPHPERTDLMMHHAGDPRRSARGAMIDPRRQDRTLRGLSHPAVRAEIEDVERAGRDIRAECKGLGEAHAIRNRAHASTIAEISLAPIRDKLQRQLTVTRVYLRTCESVPPPTEMRMPEPSALSRARAAYLCRSCPVPAQMSRSSRPVGSC